LWSIRSAEFLNPVVGIPVLRLLENVEIPEKVLVIFLPNQPKKYIKKSESIIIVILWVPTTASSGKQK
jgi:hypothetical protein